MKKRTINILLWTITSTALFIYHRVFSFDDLLRSNIVFTFIDVLTLYGSALVINRYLVPGLLYARHVAFFTVAFIVLFMGASLLIQGAEWLWYGYTHSLGKESTAVFYSFTYQLFNTYLVQFFGCVCICAYRLMNDHWTTRHNYETLKKEQAEAELHFLKAQINPHFLFNSINSLYAGIDKSNTAARNIVLKFSEILRYQLYECNVDAIGIAREIAYLQNYVALEKLRKADYLEVDFEAERLDGFNIAPLLFIPFVENAFKYASAHEHNKNLVNIKISKMQDQLIFTCTNTVSNVQGRSLHEEKGIGIGNVKRRLELIYPAKHQLRITRTATHFYVQLQITLL